MQRSPRGFNRSNSNTYCGSYTDNDSGIGFDHDYSSSSDLNSRRMNYIESYPSTQSKFSPYPIPAAIGKKRISIIPLIKFPWDGTIERIRPATMRNCQNGDYIICNTNRGAYIAYRTPIVPLWVTELVNEIELQQR
jgi:hypothetical protein